jgi:hypothetical protein
LHNSIKSNTTLHCPLCDSSPVTDYHRDAVRSYLQCNQCQLVFVPRRFHLSQANEKEIYDRHQNSPEDSGYRFFLSRLLTPLLSHVTPNSEGLDFGSGPGPTLSLMLSEEGHNMAIYDPFYAPDTNVLKRTYDFITITEVAEHLSAPRLELDQLWGLLRPGGWLGIMTKLVIDEPAFAGWHYKNDPTHISFFSRETFKHLAQHWSTEVEFIGDDVILLQKPL